MIGPFGLEGAANAYFENLGGGRFREATERGRPARRRPLLQLRRRGARPRRRSATSTSTSPTTRTPTTSTATTGTATSRRSACGAVPPSTARASPRPAWASPPATSTATGAPTCSSPTSPRTPPRSTATSATACSPTSRVDPAFAQPTFLPLSWGIALADLDLDGDLDLVDRQRAHLPAGGRHVPRPATQLPRSRTSCWPTRGGRLHRRQRPPPAPASPSSSPAAAWPPATSTATVISTWSICERRRAADPAAQRHSAPRPLADGRRPRRASASSSRRADIG